MSCTAGIDVGSTYTKAVVLGDDGAVCGRSLVRTGYRLAEAARAALDAALADAGRDAGAIGYTISTGYGRCQVPFRNLQVTDLTAAARGAQYCFPQTRTVLDIGGHTMKATRIDQRGCVTSFRLNDKCAAGTGAFLEKTARYLDFATADIGPLAMLSREPVTISGVCAVFAESEVINHLSLGASPADIMQGAIVSLAHRSVQLLRRLQVEPECTLIGGILRFESMASLLRRQLSVPTNLPPTDLVQHLGALGAAVLARRRLKEG